MDNINKYIKKKNKDENKKLLNFINNERKELLIQISKDYKLDLKELNNKYLILNNTKQKKKKTGYNIFMSNSDIHKDIKLKFPKMNSQQILTYKSQMWNTLPDSDKETYKLFAEKENS